MNIVMIITFRLSLSKEWYLEYSVECVELSSSFRIDTYHQIAFIKKNRNGSFKAGGNLNFLNIIIVI